MVGPEARIPMQPSAENAEVAVSPEVARIEQFQEALGRVTTAEVLKVEVELEGDQAVYRGANQVLAAAYKSDPSLLLHPKYESAAQPGATFTPYSSRFGKVSAHGVFFGRLDWSDGQSVPVAVKPHEGDARRSCATDYAANMAVEAAGFHNLESVGVVLSSQDSEVAYSLSRLDPTISTLESIPWRQIEKNPNMAGNLQTVWSQVARQAAHLHASGSSHGDLAARNIALAQDGGVFMIDWETARISNSVPRDAEARYALSRPDMGELMESMVRPQKHAYKSGLGMFEDDKWGGFRATVFDEYVTARLAYAKNPQELTDIQDELTELAHSLQAHLKLITG